MTTESGQTNTRAGTARLRVLRPAERDAGTTQTPGMQRKAGVSPETTGAEQLWMGHVRVAPGVESGVHHHGASESGIYIISGHARFRSGPDLSEHFDAGPGDFIFVPPWALHQEINLSQTEPVVAIVCRTASDDELVYNEVSAAEPG